jgi:hypothetical protein
VRPVLDQRRGAPNGFTPPLPNAVPPKPKPPVAPEAREQPKPPVCCTALLQNGVVCVPDIDPNAAAGAGGGFDEILAKLRNR